jgi:hypothetical protein
MSGLMDFPVLRLHTRVARPRRYLHGIELLDEHVLQKHGAFHRVRRWLRGAHPHLGVLTKGLTGEETLVEQDVIRPSMTFRVIDT